MKKIVMAALCAVMATSMFAAKKAKAPKKPKASKTAKVMNKDKPLVFFKSPAV